MKQIIQSFKDGSIDIIDAPTPKVSPGKLLINTKASLISLGTERMLIEFGKASYINKIRQQPDKAKIVWDKVKTDGLLTTLDAVRSKLNHPIPLGYSNVGIVESVGYGVLNFKPGDRVVSNGAHADVVLVPENLCAKIPDAVDDETATFTVLASIGLQGIRLINPSLGELVVVIGVGLIGLLTIQVLQANGCRVLALDIDAKKLEIAKILGAHTCQVTCDEDAINAVNIYSSGVGADAVIITASTQSSDPVSQAAKMSRKRGRIVLVGVTGLNLNRSEFYEKELSFQVSCSYGPGRYDENYEQKGIDYPIAYVRWTEQRNFCAVLDLMAKGKINVEPLISSKFNFDKAWDAYQTLSSNSQALGIILNYNSDLNTRHINFVKCTETIIDYVKAKPVIGVIGAGNYASRTLLPAFKKSNAYLHTIVSNGGLSGSILGRGLGFAQATTDIASILKNSEINTVVIATRHNTHSQFVIEALQALKNVYVEKPLALNLDELSAIEAAYHTACMQKPIKLMVGFNRRFAPQIEIMKKLLINVTAPKSIIITVNAGNIPKNSWIQDKSIGGGRIIGEACHFIDLMRFLISSEIISYFAHCIGGKVDVREDKATITLGFADGSFGTIHYLANGSPKFPKERIEVFTAGRVLQLNNFRKLQVFGWPKFKNNTLFKQDKGQNNCVKYFLASLEDGFQPIIPVAELFEVAKVNIEIANMLNLQPTC